MNDLVRQLAKERNAVAKWKARIADTKKRIDASADGKMLMAQYQRLPAAQEAEAGAGIKVRQAAMDAYGATRNKKPHPAAKIGIYQTLSYNSDTARDYAREHLPNVLNLNRRAFEKVARVLDLPFVIIRQEPRVTIARDLTAYLDTGAGDTDEQ